ncbi:MAG TPA: adenylate kinase family protein [Methanospirillum sp.]|nr:adenylate kinase family protein [Methanospirillum sp.]
MLTALTGTPGTGKSTVADELARRGHLVIRVTDTIIPYILEEDAAMQTRIVDTDQWAAEFPHSEGIVEGHIAHLLHVDRIILLRCRPDILKTRLETRKYPDAKVAENVEAELLDVLLVEALEEHGPDQVYEIDATNLSVVEVADQIEEIVFGKTSPIHGIVDWLALCPDIAQHF